MIGNQFLEVPINEKIIVSTIVKLKIRFTIPITP